MCAWIVIWLAHPLKTIWMSKSLRYVEGHHHYKGSKCVWVMEMPSISSYAFACQKYDNNYCEYLFSPRHVSGV